MKVKIFVESTTSDLMESVNEFLEEIDQSDVVDIKFNETQDTLSAMIIYKT
jgi:hypothetical protein